jgi:CheY-like chemotaxis protein
VKPEKQKTILLVEDESIIALDESVRIKKFGYIVIAAKDGETAIRQVNENPDISLVLMDINLGKGITGPETARLILQSKKLPIIFLSSHSEEEYSKVTEGIVNCGYLMKNSNDQSLSSKIKQELEKVEPGRPL